MSETTNGLTLAAVACPACRAETGIAWVQCTTCGGTGMASADYTRGGCAPCAGDCGWYRCAACETTWGEFGTAGRADG